MQQLTVAFESVASIIEVQGDEQLQEKNPYITIAQGSATRQSRGSTRSSATCLAKKTGRTWRRPRRWSGIAAVREHVESVQTEAKQLGDVFPDGKDHIELKQD